MSGQTPSRSPGPSLGRSLGPSGHVDDWSNRLAHALVENYGVKPGNRVLIRSGNNPALVAAWLAATKAGAVVVNTMPMLRAGELGKIIDKAEIALALTDSRIADELVDAA